MDLLSAVPTMVPACWRSARARAHVTQHQLCDAVTTWIDQFDSFKWLNLIAVSHHEAK
jgi:hypothetical protein